MKRCELDAVVNLDRYTLVFRGTVSSISKNMQRCRRWGCRDARYFAVVAPVDMWGVAPGMWRGCDRGALTSGSNGEAEQ